MTLKLALAPISNLMQRVPAGISDTADLTVIEHQRRQDADHRLRPNWERRFKG